MKEHYVSYECAIKFKELGFDEPCENVYSQRLPNHEPFSKRDDAVRYFQLTGNSLFTETLYPALRLDQAAAWMREYHNWHIIIEPKIWDGLHYDFKLWHKFRGYENANRGFDFSTYESALSAGISKALELLGKEVKE